MSNEKTEETKLSRRAMLTRLGLAAGAIYAAPALLQLGEAQAGSFSRSRPSRSRPSRSFSGQGRRRTTRRSFS